MQLKTTLAASLLIPLSSLAQDTEKKDAPAADPAAAAMAEYMESIKPGPEHKAFAKQAGTWDMSQTYHMPGAPAEPTKGVTVSKLVLGGRYLVSEAEMQSFMGPYSGIGTEGYDKVNKRYTHTWIDTMSTTMMVSYGQKKDDGSIEYISEPQLDAMSGTKVIFRMVSKMEGDDKMTFDMFTKAADSDEETKIMNIVYTRKK